MFLWVSKCPYLICARVAWLLFNDRWCELLTISACVRVCLAQSTYTHTPAGTPHARTHARAHTIHRNRTNPIISMRISTQRKSSRSVVRRCTLLHEHYAPSVLVLARVLYTIHTRKSVCPWPFCIYYIISDRSIFAQPSHNMPLKMSVSFLVTTDNRQLLSRPSASGQ